VKHRLNLPKNLKPRLDTLDAQIIDALSVDARIPMSDLARAKGMSGPSITERVRKLEASGLIRRFTIELDPKMLGYTLEAIVRIKPRPGQLH
jgi:Lrp/AsnC family leucine-responsive transcriptional regulator